LKCQEAKVKVREWAEAWEEPVEQAEWAATDVVEDQEVIATAQNAEKK
jgi:hypothetical protein